MNTLTHLLAPLFKAVGAIICMAVFLAVFLFFGYAMGF